MTINLRLLHFGYSEDNNTNRVCAIYEDIEQKVSMLGFVKNVFGYTRGDLNKDNSLDITVSVDVNSIKFMEMEEDGRSNRNVYDTIEDYVNDPAVKLKCINSYRNPSWMCEEKGNPLEVECTMELSYNGIPFQFVAEYRCDDGDKGYSFIPFEWYGEAWESIATKLSEAESYANPHEYLEYARNNKSECPIFGERYFPVLKFKKEDLLLGEDITGWFKNCSKPLCYGEYVYFGVRSKPSELVHGIEKVYECGTVLKNNEWDWE